MAIKRLIEHEEEYPEQPLKDIEKERKKFIQSAGKIDSSSSNHQEKVEWQFINLRIKKDAIDKIDAFVSNSMGITRTGWILQVIEEKLRKISNE